MDENPYEAPQAVSERSTESGMQKRRTGLAIVLFFVGVMWIVFMGAMFLGPSIESNKGPKTPDWVWVSVFVVASSPAVVLFSLARRALR